MPAAAVAAPTHSRMMAWSCVDAVGQRRRSGLQDVGRLHLVDVSVTNGRNRVPARPGARCVSLRTGLPHHEPMITSGAAAITCSLVTMRSLASRACAQLREDRVAARDLDQLLDPLDAGDQRIVPLLEIDARPSRKRAPPARECASSPLRSSSRERLAPCPTRRRCRRARESSAGSRRRCAG